MRRFFIVGLICTAAALGSGCAASKAYRQGIKESKAGNWDTAVARLTVANQKDPDNLSYKIALENARVEASRFHYREARKAMAAEELDKAADALDIAIKYDGGNKSAFDDRIIVREKIRKREEEKERRADFEALKARSRPLPLPVLSPRSPVPITLKFNQTSLQTILDTLGKLAGVNVVFDQDYRDKKADVNLSGVTFQEALDRITTVNRLFYKVVDQNTLILVPETPAKRRSYDEQILRTFYLQNADAAETLNLVKTLSGITKALANKELQSISVLGTPDKVALAERVVAANDKAKGEVMIEITILDVSTDKAKDYGLRIAGEDTYRAGVTFSPTGAQGELADGFANVRAHLLSSLNLADFVVSVPSTIFARFLQTDNTARILAAPRLRAAEGKKTSLKIGEEVPVPITQFTAAQTGNVGGTFAPATSFQYRNVGVNVDITPRVNPAGDISLELTAEFSVLGAGQSLAGQSLPTFLTRNVTGVLRLRDGETSLIGGLIQKAEADKLRGILGIQSIPLLNKVFTSREKSNRDNEILISITPHILRAPKVVEEDLAGLIVGTEEIPRVEGARPPLFGPLDPPQSAVPAPPSPGAPRSPAGSARPATGSVVPPAAPAPASPAAAPAPGIPAPVPPEATMASNKPAATTLPGLTTSSGPPEPSLPPTQVPAMPPAGIAPAVPVDTAGTAAPSPANAPRITAQLSPAEGAVRPGESIVLSLVVMGLRDVNALEIVLACEPVVEIVESGPGPLLTLDGAAIGAEKAFEAGKARVKFTRPTALSGSGAVANFTVRGVRPGVGSVVVESLVIQGGAGAERATSTSPARIVVNP